MSAPQAVPSVVRSSVHGWLTAIGLGAAEALVRLALPEPPTGGELAVRFAIYLGLVALVLALRSGRDAVRWAVVVLLGVLGAASLVGEPIGWLADGGSPAEFLAGADPLGLLAAALRVAHIGAVSTALALLFRPAATEFFRATPGDTLR